MQRRQFLRWTGTASLTTVTGIVASDRLESELRPSVPLRWIRVLNRSEGRVEVELRLTVADVEMPWSSGRYPPFTNEVNEEWVVFLEVDDVARYDYAVRTGRGGSRSISGESVLERVAGDVSEASCLGLTVYIRDRGSEIDHSWDRWEDCDPPSTADRAVGRPEPPSSCRR